MSDTFNPSLMESIKAVQNRTDGWPWYWLSYGEKCYAFAAVEAYPANEGDAIPQPGTRLEPHEEEETLWVGENGTAMEVGCFMAEHEAQNGDAICRFIAQAHAVLVYSDETTPKEPT